MRPSLKARSMWDFGQTHSRHDHHHKVFWVAPFLRGRLAYQVLPVGPDREYLFVVDDDQFSLVLLHLGRFTCPMKIFDAAPFLLIACVLVHVTHDMRGFSVSQPVLLRSAIG